MVRQTRYLWVSRLAFEQGHQTIKWIRNVGHLHKKGIGDERIVMHLDPSDISDDLEDNASNHAAQETPCAMFDTKEDLEC